MKVLIGPFSQIVTLRGLPLKGALNDKQLDVVEQGGVVVKDGVIKAVGNIDALRHLHHDATYQAIDRPAVLLPGFVDCHTHMCYAGSCSEVQALRVSGMIDSESLAESLGISNVVETTRQASEPELLESLLQRLGQHFASGFTTVEIKSGYGLTLDQELKMLRVMKMAHLASEATVINTCFSAQVKPREFTGDDKSYLQHIVAHLLPVIKEKKLGDRVDIFIEKSAFCQDEASRFLIAAKLLGFNITLHSDLFSSGSIPVAVSCGAHSAAHLEAISEEEIQALAHSDTVAVVLPGASLGLGLHYAPARKLLDAGASVAIASDWNPCFSPHGDLLMQAAFLSAFEKLSTTEVFAGLTFRAANALRLNDRGIIDKGMKAEFQAYPTNDYRDILYYQGKMKPFKVWN